MCRQTNTHRQSQTHERPQRLELLIEQCKLTPVTANNLCRSRMRISLIEYHISNRNREIRDSVAVNHVSKIDQSGDGHAFRIDEQIVIIRVTMNYTSPQTLRRLVPAL